MVSQDFITEPLIDIQFRQEGIVVKNPGSVYEPGARNQSWVKVKPDYIDELRDNCDLLVVGADFGTGKRGSKLSQFLLAVRDDRNEDENNPK
jgi:DNA ligase-4